jgi:DNA-binding MarR family transcriptional regulator
MRDMVQATEPDRGATPSVHPGWLTAEPVIDISNSDAPEVLRFEAFMQILRTAGALDRAATDILADLGLTAGAFGALLELQRSGETGLAPSELARKLAVARRTSTLYVDILVRNGWAERRPHPADRRMVLASLTEEGLTLLAQVGAAYRQRLGALVGDISPVQAERLRQLLALVPTGGETDHS